VGPALSFIDNNVGTSIIMLAPLVDLILAAGAFNFSINPRDHKSKFHTNRANSGPDLGLVRPQTFVIVGLQPPHTPFYLTNGPIISYFSFFFVFS